MQMMLFMNLMEKNFAVKGRHDQFIGSLSGIIEQTVCGVFKCVV